MDDDHEPIWVAFAEYRPPHINEAPYLPDTSGNSKFNESLGAIFTAHIDDRNAKESDPEYPHDLWVWYASSVPEDVFIINPFRFLLITQWLAQFARHANCLVRGTLFKCLTTKGGLSRFPRRRGLWPIAELVNRIIDPTTKGIEYLLFKPFEWYFSTELKDREEKAKQAMAVLLLANSPLVLSVTFWHVFVAVVCSGEAAGCHLT
eukprot:m.495956 g.495956  ORF g.495956 m.495956 type:complete len:205 (-) comp46080_c0_seq1:399-1013(-)